MSIKSSFLSVPLLIIVLARKPTTFGYSLKEDSYLGLIIWDYQEKRLSCGQREGLNQYPRPLDHHALTKWTQKIKCSHSLYHYTYPVTSFLFGSQVKQMFFLFENFFYSIYLVFFFADHGTSPPAAMYETYYVTAHKQPCRAASFSQNGKMISNRADVKNGNQKLIFSLFQCSDSTNSYSGTLNKGIQIRCVRQRRSIKRDIELPVANHDVRDVSVLVA